MLKIFLTLLLALSTASIICAQGKHQSWLTGTWEGTGYQMDDNSTWTMRLTVQGNRYRIEYPSLNCSGRWIPLSVGARNARFREQIRVGIEECLNQGRVDIQRLSRWQIAYRYTERGARDVSASAILNRKK